MTIGIYCTMSASFRCDGRLLHSRGPAVASASCWARCGTCMYVCVVDGSGSAVAPVKRSLSADRQQTAATERYHDNVTLTTLQRPSSSSSSSPFSLSSSSLSRKCPRLDLHHPHTDHHQSQAAAESSHKCTAGTQT